MLIKITSRISLFSLITLVSASHMFATNGMNLEGYGPIALGMGGTSLASDATTAAVMNNPATLILQEADNQLNLAVGVLGPDVSMKSPDGQVANSNSDAFFMPAIGFIKKHENLRYGVAVFGQGGMGTHYASDSFVAGGSGGPAHSCVSVGRVIAPLSYRINEKLSIGVTADFVWAGMNLEMPMTGSQFADLTTPGMQYSGAASGSLLNSMMPFMMAGYQLDWARFEFDTGTQLTGEAMGGGIAAKIGLLYQPNDKLSIGVVYHSQTLLNDLETDSATMKFQMSNSNPPPGYPTVFPATVTGDIAIKDFEWPSLVGVGFTYKANDTWTLSLDLKEVMWSDVMENFTMKFTVNGDASNNMTSMGGPNMQNQSLEAKLYQNWDNQLIVAVGASYKANDTLTLLAGFNHAKNPIPDSYLNPLFPATPENHLTAGFSWQTGDRSRVDFGMSLALEAEDKIPTPYGNITSTHSQINGQIMYSFNW